jgi:type I restriction enzyme M protein
LRNPLHLTGEEGSSARGLQTFDRVLANPPFSLKEWGHEAWSAGDKFGRDQYGCPPPSYGDLAFVQHMVASLKKDGMLGVVLPHGILFRGGAEGRIREALLKQDMVEAVIGIAPNLFYGTGIPACVLIINKSKPKARKGKVLFINGTKEYQEGKNQNSLLEKHIQRLSQAFYEYKDEDRFSRVVSIDEIATNDYNLNIPRYVPDMDEEEKIDVAVELIKLEDLRAARDTAEAEMIKHLKELGYGS